MGSWLQNSAGTIIMTYMRESQTFSARGRARRGEATSWTRRPVHGRTRRTRGETGVWFVLRPTVTAWVCVSTLESRLTKRSCRAWSTVWLL